MNHKSQDNSVSPLAKVELDKAGLAFIFTKPRLLYPDFLRDRSIKFVILREICLNYV